MDAYNINIIDVFEDEEKKIRLLAEDGVRVPLGQIFWRDGDNILIGELVYCHALVEEKDERGVMYETILPFCLVCTYKGKELTMKVFKPYIMLKSINLSDKPVIIEARTRSSEPLNTLMSLPAVLQFVKNTCNELPSWRDAFEKVKASVKRFVNLDWDPRLYDIVVSWIMATYFAEVYSAFPFLYSHGPQGTGKTRLLKTAIYLSRHGFVVTDPTEPTLFRMAEAFRPSLGVDESLLGPQAWRLIRAAFKRGSFVPRIEKTRKEEFIISLFDPYMPCAFSSTEMPRDLGGVEADEARAIFIFMRQMPDPAGRDPEAWDFRDERDLLYQLRLGKAPEVVESFKSLESAGLPFRGHEREIWLPLLSIARLVGPDVYQNVLEYALELSGIKEMEQYREEKTVVRAILLMFRARYAEAVKMNKNAHIDCIEFTSSALQEYIRMVLEEWGELDEQLFPKQWRSEKIGRILTRMGIFRKAKKGKSHYVVSAKSLQDLYKRFWVGVVGVVGVKTRSINTEETPTETGGVGDVGVVGVKMKSINAKETPTQGGTPSEKGLNQASLGAFISGVGVQAEKIDFKSAPTTPTTPTQEMGEEPRVGVNSEKIDFKSAPTTPTTPTRFDKPFAVLRRETPIRWLPCPSCGRSGLEYYVKFVDGEEAFVCEVCARRLKEKWMGE